MTSTRTSSAHASDAGDPGSAAEPEHAADWDHSGSDVDRDEELLEPQLKYERLGSDVKDILERSQATCLCLSDKLLALGTSRGTLHILDYSGNEVKRLEGHQSPISALCFDIEAEYLASAAQTASVRVQNLYSEEVLRLEFRAGIKALALDPRFGSRKNREVVTGTNGGVLQISAHGWLGRNDTVLHSGEGPIHEAQWVSHLIVWSNDLGARVYDHSTHRHVGLIERPKGGIFPPAFRCSIFIVEETKLFLGWPDCIKVVKVTDAPLAEQLNGNKKTLQPVLEIPTTHFVRGVAPFGDELAVLVYREGQEQVPVSTSATPPVESTASQAPPTPNSTAGGSVVAGSSLAGSVLGRDGEGEDTGRVSPGGAEDLDADGFAAQEAMRPELRIISKDKVERAVDVLPVNAYQDNLPQDYFLVPSASLKKRPGVETHKANNRHLEDAMYFVVSPKDVVVGRPRGADDRVSWLLQHGKYEAALTIARAHRTAVPAMYEQVADKYLDYLLTIGEADKAAALCPRLLGSDSKWWERWVYLFAQRRYLPALADHVPTMHPCQLRPTAYEMILNSFLLSPADHPKLLKLVKKWPRGIYQSSTLVEAVSMRMQRLGGASHALWEILAHLYLQQGRPDLSLAIYLQMHNPVVFDFMRQHSLVHTINGSKAAMLLEINEEEAITFLVQEMEIIPPSAVVPVLMSMMSQQAEDSKEYRLWRRRLHNYLHRVFVVDHTAAAEYHHLQVELYADYDINKLMQFLNASQYYPLEAALETCQARNLVPEMVFVLGRMGNTRQALYLIIERLADIPRALDFVKEQQDDELWEDLISWALSSPETTGALLDHCGGNINPLQLISRIPEGMHIPSLRDRIRNIIADFRTQTTLREGCNVILHSDCMALVSRLFVEIRRAVRVVYIPPHAIPEGFTSPNSPCASTTPVTATGKSGAAVGVDSKGQITMVPLPSLTVGGVMAQWQKYEADTGRMMSVPLEQVPNVVKLAASQTAASPLARAAAGDKSVCTVQVLIDTKEGSSGPDAFRIQSEGRQRSLSRLQTRGKTPVVQQNKEMLPSLVQ